MTSSPRQAAGEDEEDAAARADADALEAAQEELGFPRPSEELKPVSLADLFAGDPECAAAKQKADKGKAGLARTHAFAGAGLDDELELRKLQVFVRIRPSVTAGAPRWDAENCIHATSKYSIAIAPPEGSQAYKSGDRGQTYSFSRVFEAETGQDEYYNATAAPLVRDLLRNRQHNSAMMAYGITAAGKTYTIEGTKEAPGVMPRALVDLFGGLAAHVEPVVARASYYEVYNEQIYDLLDEQGVGPLGHRAALRLKEDALGRVFVAGLSEVEVGCADEALALLRRGSRLRQRGETALNYSSSRSHSIFTIALYQQGLDAQASDEASADGEAEEAGGGGEEKLGRISFVDLAGSERAQRTGNVGVRLKESVAINSSLMTLGRCLEALRWNQQHKGGGNLRVVPYRESKVTHLFRDALHGWGQVVLSVNVSPASMDYDETAHVLKYAAVATQIGTIQQAEAPRRTIKAVSPAIKKVKRKAALPPEARRGQGGPNRAKKAKKGAAAPAAKQQEVEAAAAEAADVAALEAAEGSLELLEGPQEQEQQRGDDEEGPVVEQASGSSPQCSSPAGLEAEGVAEYELADAGAECNGTPLTPLGEDEEAAAALQAQVQQLIVDLQAAEERCVMMEAEVREEVADEMAQLLRDMEESYRQRLEAEVAALERKMGGGAAAEGKRRGRGGKGAQASHDEAAAEQLAAAREEAAHASAEAEQLRQQVSELQAQAEQRQVQEEQRYAQAGQRAAELEAEVAAAQQACSQAQEQLAGEQQRSAALAAELMAAQEATSAAQEQLEGEQQRSAALEEELSAMQSAAGKVQASLEVERERAAALEAEAAAAAALAAEAQAALASEGERAAGLEAHLAAMRAVADTSQVSEGYEEALQEAVTQLEANKGMELDMAEEQAERLRKQNMALQQRLGAALAALSTLGSPALARMAQAAPEGNGRGAGGTPHDVALARARQAAAADDLAAAAAAGATAGGSAAPRSRSRFASETKAAAAEPVGGLETVAEEEEQQHDQQQEGVEAEEPKPTRRGRGRPRKTVAFAGLEPAADDKPAVAAVLEQQQQQPEQQPEQHSAAAAESQRSRRKTRAGAAALPTIAEQEQQPLHVKQEQPEAAAETVAEEPQPDKPQRGRGKTHAVAADTPAEQAQLQEQVPAAAEPVAVAEEPQPAKPQRGRRKTHAVVQTMPAQQEAEQPQEQAPDSAAAEPAVVAEKLHPDKPQRGRCKTHAAAAAVPVEQAQEQAEEHAQEPAPADAVTELAAAEQQAAAGDGVTGQPPAAEPAAKQRRRGRQPKANKENAAQEVQQQQQQLPLHGTSLVAALAAMRKSDAAAREAAASAAATQKQDQQEAGEQAAAEGGPAKGGKRRKRLLPSVPMSAAMRAELGELGDAALRRPAPAVEGGGGKRSRRQTQFFRL